MTPEPEWDLPGFTHVYSGKVRDLYRIDDERLLRHVPEVIGRLDVLVQVPGRAAGSAPGKPKPRGQGAR